MRVVKVSSRNTTPELYAFKFASLSHAIYAVLYEEKMRTLNKKAPTVHFKSKIEEYDVLFATNSDGELSPYTMNLLKQRRIDLIYDTSRLDPQKRQIYRKGKSWYVFTATSGGWDGTNPRKRPMEELASPQRPVAYAPRRGLVPPTATRGRHQIRTNFLLPVSPYEFFPNPREFQAYKEYKREGFQRMAFQNGMDFVFRMASNAPRKTSFAPVSKQLRFNSPNRWRANKISVPANGGYYHKRGPYSRMCDSSNDRVTLSPDCSLDNIFHSILAYSDSCHDFSTYIPKRLIFQLYKGDPRSDTNYYKYDLDKLRTDAQSIVASQLSRSGHLNLSEDSNTIIFLSRLNNVMNNFEDEDNYAAYTPDLLKVVNPQYKSENEIGTKGPSTWEAPFLSKFYYSIFPIMDRENVYKLNVRTSDWGSNLHKMLLAENFTNYFFDMGIARKTEIEENYRGRDLLSFIETGKPDNSRGGSTSMITQLDTIAKWWDPSTGGNDLKLKTKDLVDFSAILRKEVLQQCGNVRFIEIQELSSDPENTIRLNMEGMVYPDRNKLYLHLETKGGIRLYIAVFKDVFTINNCTWLYDYIENWKKIKNKQLQRIVGDNFQDLKLFVLSLKRSGDHGQSMYLKWYNKQYGNQRSFLITGDSLCAVKALYEKVPVLFFKYSMNTANSKPVLDLYFHTPSFINKQRENYIKTHLSHLLSDNSKKLIDLEEEKQFTIDYVNNDFSINITIADTSDKDRIEKDMHTLKLCKLYYEFKDYDMLSKKQLSKSLAFFDNKLAPIDIDEKALIEMDVSEKLIASIVADMDRNRNSEERQSPRIKVQEAQKIVLERNKDTRERFENVTRTISDRIEDVIRNTEIIMTYLTVFLEFEKGIDRSIFRTKKLLVMRMMSNFFKNTVTNPRLHNSIEGHYSVLHQSVAHEVFRNTDILHDKNFKLFELLYEINEKLTKIEATLSASAPPKTAVIANRPPAATSSSSKPGGFLQKIASYLQKTFSKN
jgi:hypothetical protein